MQWQEYFEDGICLDVGVEFSAKVDCRHRAQKTSLMMAEGGIVAQG